MGDPGILVFDIETYPDISLIEAQGKSLPLLREELKLKTGSDFLPPIYHVPIAMAVLWVEPTLHKMRAEVLTGTPGQEISLVDAFWRYCDELLGEAAEKERDGLLVSFNGSEFDIPVLELRALKYGLRANLRARDQRFHFDVPFFLANYKDPRKRSLRLDSLSKFIGLPGKILMEGSEVQSQFESGTLEQIGRYCLLDVLQTYLLFLRCRLLSGRSTESYEDAVRSFRFFVSNSGDPNIKSVSSYVLDPLRANTREESIR